MAPAWHSGGGGVECHGEYGLGSPVTNKRGRGREIIGKIREYRCCERSSIIISVRLLSHQELWYLLPGVWETLCFFFVLVHAPGTTITSCLVHELEWRRTQVQARRRKNMFINVYKLRALRIDIKRYSLSTQKHLAMYILWFFFFHLTI